MMKINMGVVNQVTRVLMALLISILYFPRFIYPLEFPLVNQNRRND
jgi:hypothetical protein